MYIRVSQAGGFAGVPVELGSTDTAAMPAAEGKRLERLVHDADFFHLPARVGTTEHAEIGADLGTGYEITVRDGERSHTVSLPDGGGGADAAAGGLQGIMSAVIRRA